MGKAAKKRRKAARFVSPVADSQPRELSAATQLAPVPTPKVRKGQQTYPSFVQGANVSESALPRTDLQVANKDLLDYRFVNTDTRELLRTMSKVSPDLSASVFTYVRTAITKGFTLTAHNLDTSFNREATLLLQQLVSRFNILKDYEQGFTGSWDLRSTAEALAREMLLYGGCSLELALNKARIPSAIVPISILDIQFKQDDKGVKPVQVIGSEEIDLDIPTFFYAAMDSDLKDPYANSPMEAGIQPMLADLDFFNQLRRILARVIHPRLDISIDEEKLRENIPAEIRSDPQAVKEYIDGALTKIQTDINNLGVDDALVHWDFITVGFVDHGTASPAEQERLVQNMARQRTLAGTKTLPSILGHDSGSQNVASTQSILFVKSVEGVQEKLNSIFSQAFTLAARLMGLDVYASFRYDTIELRPESELEAFRLMRQDRILKQLSLGLITDDEASLILTGNVTPAGYVPKSGTGFHESTSAVSENPYSPTGQPGDSEATINKTSGSDAPADAKTS